MTTETVEIIDLLAKDTNPTDLLPQNNHLFDQYHACCGDRNRIIAWASLVCTHTPKYLNSLNRSVASHSREAVKVAGELFDICKANEGDRHLVSDIVHEKTRHCALLIYRSFLSQTFGASLLAVDSDAELKIRRNILEATTWGTAKLYASLRELACSLVCLLPCTSDLVACTQSKPLATRQKVIKYAARVIERRRNSSTQKVNAQKLMSALYSKSSSGLPPLYWLHLCSWPDIHAILIRVCDAYKLCGTENPLSPRGMLSSIRWHHMWKCHAKDLSEFFLSIPEENQIEGNHYSEDCPEATDTLIKVLTQDPSRQFFDCLNGRHVSLETFLKINPRIREHVILHRPSPSEWIEGISELNPEFLVRNNNHDQLWKIVTKLCGAKNLSWDREIMNTCVKVHSDMCDAMLQVNRDVLCVWPPKWFDPGRFTMHCGRFDQSALAAMHALAAKHWGRHWFMDRYLVAIHQSFAAKRVMVRNKTAACPPMNWRNIQDMFDGDKPEDAIRACKSFLDDLHGVVPDAKMLKMWHGVRSALPEEDVARSLFLSQGKEAASKVLSVWRDWLKEDADLWAKHEKLEAAKQKPQLKASSWWNLFSS